MILQGTARQTTRTYGQTCPIARTLDLIGDRWTLLILRDLFLGDARFTEMRARSPGMPTKILSDRLKSLEQHGIIERRIYSEHPIRAAYHLTALGLTLGPVVSSLYTWGMQYAVPPNERRIIRKHVAGRGPSARRTLTNLRG